MRFAQTAAAMDVKLGILAATAAIGLGYTLRGVIRIARQAHLLQITRQATRDHAALLRAKQKQFVVHDGYGNYRLQAWIDHIDYFIEAVIQREARARGLDPVPLLAARPFRIRVTRTVLRVLREAPDAARPGDITDDHALSGRHYETLCQNLLEIAGWVVATTPVTGDQGADLIADRGGQRVVIQCKFHAKSIGNKAVQEAFAAKAFHAGQHAAVVSNAAFTRSAQQLASVNGVLLLHHEQLADLGKTIGLAEASAPKPASRRKKSRSALDIGRA
jgi:restriction system protein